MLNKKLAFASYKVFLLGLALTALFGVSAVNAEEKLAVPTMFTPLAGQEFTSPVPVISGKSMSGDAVLVFIDNTLNGEALVVDNVFEYRPFLPLSSGDHTIRIKAKEALTGELSEFSEERVVRIIPNPAPAILAPASGARLGQDRVWVGGVVKNGSLVRILADGVEITRLRAKDHLSGTGAFSASLSGLSLGDRVITAIARDAQGKDSFASAPVVVSVLPPTPAPVLMRPVVNSDAGIERPFVVGIAKNNLVVTIVLDGVIQQRIPLGEDSSGVISFSWQPTHALSLGHHTIEAYASDQGKLSNNSKPVFWQVGEVPQSPAAVEESVSDEAKAPVEDLDTPTPISVRDDSQAPAPPLTVREDLEPTAPESPIIPDEPVLTEDLGRVEPEEDAVAFFGESENEQSEADEDSVTPLGPGAVVRDVSSEDRGEFAFNNSLIIGIVILVFLLLSILVWYIQEKREALSERVVSIFRENDEGADKRIDTLPGDMPASNAVKLGNHSEHDDLPPPPPPMF